MSTSSSLPDSICANCGKGEESSGDLKSCTACKLVKYCNRECQIAHRPQHKKSCKKRAAELHDEKLFEDHPPREECPICMLPLPIDADEQSFESCCGKIICNGCVHAMTIEDIKKGKKNEEINMCPYCRTPPHISDEDYVERIDKLMKNGNADAFCVYAGDFLLGRLGLQQDQVKANELLLKAGELGCAAAYHNLGNSYYAGRGVEIDEKKAMHYYELAAMNGNLKARHNLGATEYDAGNYARAFKHLILSARAGYKLSLDNVKKGFMNGYVTKEEYANTLREYQNSQDEMKSKARDKALAARNERMGG